MTTSVAMAEGRPGWRGVFAYVPTPIDDHGRLQENVLRNLVEYVIEGGVTGVSPLGGTGEYPLVDPRDRIRTIEVACDQAAGRVPVVPGVGGFTPKQLIREMDDAVTAGADGHLCILHGYYPMSSQELIEAYREVGEAAERPVVIYHNPGQCHLRLTDDVVEAFATMDNLDYVKDASGIAANLTSWARFDSKPRIFCGTATSITAALMMGAIGWMAGPATLLPRECSALFELSAAADWPRAVRLERALTPLLHAFRRHGQPVTVKTVLSAKGWAVGAPLAPLQRPSSNDAAWIVEQVELAEHQSAGILDEVPEILARSRK